jgi:outer membrane lipoprotein-sorting protein
MRACPSFSLLAVLLSFSVSPLCGNDSVDLTPVEKWIDAQSKLNSLHGNFVQERKMRSVKRTFTKEGVFWFEKPGRVRWEIEGSYLAVKNDKEVLILEPKKKEMKRYPMEALQEEDRFRGIAFMEAGFPRTLDDFLKGFRVIQITKEGDYFNVEAKIRDSKAALALTRIVFQIYEKDHQLKAFQLFFRDKSTIYNRFTRVFPNKEVPPGTFSPDTGGYRVTE